MSGIRGPATLTIENPDGAVFIEEVRGTNTVEAFVHHVRGTHQAQPVDFHFQNLGAGFSGGPDRLIVSVLLPRPKRKSLVINLDSDRNVMPMYQDVGEVVPLGIRKRPNIQPAGSTHVLVRIPNHLMGHVQVRTWNAWIGFRGFASAPQVGFGRIVRIERLLRPTTDTHFGNLNYSSVIQADSVVHDCPHLIGDMTEIFNYYLDR